jgi:hypothetical protein
MHIELPRVRTQQVGYAPGQMDEIGYERAIVQRQGRAKLTPDLGRQTGAPMTPRPRGPARLRGSSGFRGPSRDGGVSVEIVRASPGEQHVQIWMAHAPRIGARGVSCLHPNLTHPG